MDKKRILLMAGLAVAAVVVFTQVKKMGTPAPVQTAAAPAPIVQKVEYVDVLVATQNMALGSRISEKSVKWKQWPAEALSPALISNDLRPQAIEELDRAIVRSPILEGEPISENKLVLTNGSGVMAALLKPGMRAVTTRISVDTAAGGFIQPGDRVDIILTQAVQPKSSASSSSQRVFTADTIFENVHVLAIDQTYSTGIEGGATVIGSTATFEMSQDDAEMLQQSVSKGDLSLTLRGIIRSNAQARSAAKNEKEEVETESSLTVYRGGQPQQVAIRGQ